MIIKDRLSLAESYVELLTKLKDRVKEPRDLNIDLILRGAIERYLHPIIEALIDVGLRIASILGASQA